MQGALQAARVLCGVVRAPFEGTWSAIREGPDDLSVLLHCAAPSRWQRSCLSWRHLQQPTGRLTRKCVFECRVLYCTPLEIPRGVLSNFTDTPPGALTRSGILPQPAKTTRQSSSVGEDFKTIQTQPAKTSRQRRRQQLVAFRFRSRGSGASSRARSSIHGVMPGMPLVVAAGVSTRLAITFFWQDSIAL